MLTTPDKLLFLHLLVDDLHDKLLHHLSRDGGEVDRPVVPWVLLLALFEDISRCKLSLIKQILEDAACHPALNIFQKQSS